MPGNPALADLEPLVGRWRMELYDANFLPPGETRVTGSVEIDWIAAGGALLICQRESEESDQPPAATWIIGRDDGETDYSVLYADRRGVSRIYAMSFDHGHWRMWRHTPQFAQRFDAEIDLDGQTIRGRWEKSVAGAAWEHDFRIDYIRRGSTDPNG
ncbi:MAG: hypothetical protein JO156_12515 [Solirubrobacterales bacterium]|nr:hypothetical protein [Solirubrobacterales bacterium]